MAKVALVCDVPFAAPKFVRDEHNRPRVAAKTLEQEVLKRFLEDEVAGNGDRVEQELVEFLRGQRDSAGYQRNLVKFIVEADEALVMHVSYDEVVALSPSELLEVVRSWRRFIGR